MRVLQWIAWIAVLGLAAALPWLVNDWIHQHDRSASPTPATGAVLEDSAPVSEPVSPDRRPGDDLSGLIETVTGPEMTDSPVAPSAAEKAAGFIRDLFSTSGDPAVPDGSGRIESERSRDAAQRVMPPLEKELSAKGLRAGLPVFVRIFKESNELELWMEPEPGAEYVLFKSWPICKWSGELGPKLKEGDGQAPEGFYFVPPRRMNPESQYHLAFDLGFPNDYDRHHGRTGSYLMVHGNCVSIGCFAMTDPAIEEIYTLAAAALQGGQAFFRVHSFPFRMSDERMDSLKTDAKWFDFWANLKEGYDYFEFLKRPPNVTVAEGKYRFH